MKRPSNGRFLALSAALALGACAKSRPIETRFTAEVPAGWDFKETKGADPSITYSSGTLEITATLYGLKGSFEAAPKDLVNSLEVSGGLADAGTLTIGGRTAKAYMRRYTPAVGGADSPGGSPAVTDETWILAPAPQGYWALLYRRPAAGAEGSAVPDEAWRKFLSSFKPLP